MTDDPRWHGWATPAQVREMMREMTKFLEGCGYVYQVNQGREGHLDIAIINAKTGEELADI